MNAGLIVLLITVMASLVLAIRAFRSHRLGSRKTVLMAAIWAAIIVVLAFVLQRFTP